MHSASQTVDDAVLIVDVPAETAVAAVSCWTWMKQPMNAAPVTSAVIASTWLTVPPVPPAGAPTVGTVLTPVGRIAIRYSRRSVGFAGGIPAQFAVVPAAPPASVASTGAPARTAPDRVMQSATASAVAVAIVNVGLASPAWKYR